MSNNQNSSEKLYDSLIKAFSSTKWMIKYYVYPISFLLMIILGASIWWGIDIRNSKNEINNAKQNIEEIQKSLQLKEREIDLSVREIENRAEDRFNNLVKTFSKFETDFSKMNNDFNNLKLRYEKALSENDELFKQLKTDNKSLDDFSNRIKSSISQYTNEIEYARKGVEQRKLDIEQVLLKRNEQLDAVQKSMVLLSEYLVLANVGRNQFPDPNAKREIEMIDQILVLLLPNINERNAVVKRINDSITK